MDLKGFGYLISTVSVFLLGMVAWPGPGEPQWKAIVPALGMAASIGGMGVRWLSHRKDRRQIDHAEAQAQRAHGGAHR